MAGIRHAAMTWLVIAMSTYMDGSLHELKCHIRVGDEAASRGNRPAYLLYFYFSCIRKANQSALGFMFRALSGA